MASELVLLLQAVVKARALIAAGTEMISLIERQVAASNLTEDEKQTILAVKEASESEWDKAVAEAEQRSRQK